MEPQNDLVAGRNAVMELIKSGVQISRIMVSNRSREGSVLHILALAREQNVLVKEVALEKLNALYPSGNHQGVIAFISPIEFAEVEDLLEKAKETGEPPFLVILDGIMDVHNLGAIARTAEAAGAHGLILGKHRTASVTPIAVKASAGALFHIPVARVTNIPAVIDELKEKGVWICGTHQDASMEYHEADLKGPLGVVIGGEDKGMSRLVQDKCDFIVKISMKGKMASLNASNAAAVILFEALRQRR
ncbi:MAG: 23S rRNA (guanosine(2251)-2'-O)-methyltransferase RlmB [Clostridia bacterium]